jgi:RNA-directed DNA polymerase
VDGFKALTPKARVDLYNKIKDYDPFTHKAKPLKRAEIPKKNSKKLRPLGIPVIIDRVFQNVFKLALEPQWEYHFESTSYGFRPKRSQHDAVEAIFNKVSAHSKKQWIFEGDFKGCFDNLDHNHIMKCIKDFPGKETIRRWLESGVIDNNVFKETSKGTPQGGVISPLLANIALHGMEKELEIEYYISHLKSGKVNAQVKGTKAVVRYADDFIIVCSSKDEAESMYEKLKPYLNKRGLELAKNKTRVIHITEGFDFLGFNFRQYATNKEKGRLWKLIVKPSKESQQKFKNRIKEIFEKNKGSNVLTLIKDLNPIIRGTANYWVPVPSKEIFSKMDNYIFWRTMRFLNRLHPHKSNKWRKKKYFKPDIHGQSQDNWLLTDTTNKYQLRRMAWTAIKRHEMVKFKNSPFDRSLEEYYMKRDIIGLRQDLAKKQKHRCTLCSTTLFGEEGLEIHHSKPKFHGGTDEKKNLKLVHISCHIRWHKAFPARGPLQSNIQIKAFKKMLKKVQGAKEISYEKEKDNQYSMITGA